MKSFKKASGYSGLSTCGGTVPSTEQSSVSLLGLPPPEDGPSRTALHVESGMKAVSSGEIVEDEKYEFHYTKEIGPLVVTPAGKPVRPITLAPTEHDAQLESINKTCTYLPVSGIVLATVPRALLLGTLR